MPVTALLMAYRVDQKSKLFNQSIQKVLRPRDSQHCTNNNSA